MEWNELRSAIDERIKKEFIPLLRQRGFKRSYPHFRRKRNDHLDILGFQFSLYGPQFWIEISSAPYKEVLLSNGKVVPPEKLKYYHCMVLLRKRIGDNPFDMEKETPQLIINKVISCMEDAEQWWREKHEG